MDMQVVWWTLADAAQRLLASDLLGEEETKEEKTGQDKEGTKEKSERGGG